MTNEQMRLTADGDRLMKDWKSSQKRLADAERELSHAKSNLCSATNAFGKWLCPPDAKPGEVFHVWIGDILIGACLTQSTPHSYELKLRQRGKDWDRT